MMQLRFFMYKIVPNKMLYQLEIGEISPVSAPRPSNFFPTIIAQLFYSDE